MRLLGKFASVKQALDVEEELLKQFRAQSHLHLKNYPVPDPTDLLYWWPLMQHHGAPTRLLDWTASPYVAAYFATVSHWNEDGAIWFVHPRTLAEESEKAPSLELPLHELWLTPTATESVIAIPALMQSDRMIAQQGHFTLCFNVLGDQSQLLAKATVEHISPERDIFGKFIIPSDRKPEFLRQLRAMNVTATSLFPGLDGLGRSLAEVARLASVAFEMGAA